MVWRPILEKEESYIKFTGRVNAHHAYKRNFIGLLKIIGEELKTNIFVKITENLNCLNIPSEHDAAQSHASLILQNNKDYCLRTHCTTVHRVIWEQVKKRENAKDFEFKEKKRFLWSIGTVLRNDDDRTHLPSFNQVEVLSPYSSIESLFVNLSGIIKILSGGKVRWRRSLFPFTCPSFELDYREKDRWCEIAGCGIIRQNLSKGGPCTLAGGFGLERLIIIIGKFDSIRNLYSLFVPQEFLPSEPVSEWRYGPIIRKLKAYIII